MRYHDSSEYDFESGFQHHRMTATGTEQPFDYLQVSIISTHLKNSINYGFKCELCVT